MNPEVPMISSLQNPAIKQLVKLREARERKKSGLTRIDGARELLRCLQAQHRPESLYVCRDRLRGEEGAEALALCAQHGVRAIEITEPVYEKIRFGDRDEGLCATVAIPLTTPDELRLPDRPLVAVAEGTEKPGNLGALLRTADGAGVDAIVLADPACDPTNPNVVRSSMGTIFSVPLALASTAEVQRWLERRSMQVITTRPQATRLYHQVDLRGPTAIVLGAEHDGLTKSWDSCATHAVGLPMNGIADSLNLSVAAAVLLYEAVRQRHDS